MFRCFNSLGFALITSTLMLGCGGGGGDSSDGSTDPNPPVNGVSHWKISADVSRDGCGERIAEVNQTVTMTQQGDSLSVDTTIVEVGATPTTNGFVFGFEETNGDCTRNYNTQFSYLTDTTADVSITVASNCRGISCQDEWAGTAVKVD